jgi:hypothetical protein
MDYLVRYIAHVKASQRHAIQNEDFPNGLPPAMWDELIIQSNSKQGLVNAIAKESMKYLQMQGMVVRKDPTLVERAGEVENDRMFLPMHMIAYIDSAYFLLGSDVPIVTSTGMAVLGNGKPVELQ